MYKCDLYKSVESKQRMQVLTRSGVAVSVTVETVSSLIFANHVTYINVPCKPFHHWSIITVSIVSINSFKEILESSMKSFGSSL